MKRILVGLIASLAFLASCSQEPGCGKNKDVFLANYFALVEKATEADLALSDKEWKDYDGRFRAYVEECYEQYEADLAGNERRKFWSQAMKYYAQRYGDGLLKTVGKTTDKTGQRIKEEVRKLWENPPDTKKNIQPKVKGKDGSKIMLKKKESAVE